MMEDPSYDYKVEGEVIKMIHNELPAVRWTCGGCGEDACTIFYEAEDKEKIVECESCGAATLVQKTS
jgi:ribosomal protein S27E